MPATNYMVFACSLSRYEKRAKATRSDITLNSTRHAIQRAEEAYKAKDYVSAEQWRNAADRASLEVS